MSKHTQHADLRGLGAHDESPYSWQTFVASLFMVTFIVVLIGFAQQADERAAAELQRMARAEKNVEAMPTQLAAAYERGLVDALEALRDSPEGVALAQACLVQGARR